MEKEGKYNSSLRKRMNSINVNFVIRDLKHLFRIKCSRQRMLLVIRNLIVQECNLGYNMNYEGLYIFNVDYL